VLGVNLVILFEKRVRYVKKVKNHWFRQRTPFEKFAQSPPSAIHKWNLDVTHLGRRMRTGQNGSTRGELKTTRIRQSSHKLVIGNHSLREGDTRGTSHPGPVGTGEARKDENTHNNYVFL